MIPAFFDGLAGAGVTKPRVLVAEDEFLLRLDAAESIRRLGWDVVEVSSADEALELLRYSVRFDLLLTDIDMPGQANGLDLAAYVRDHHPHMKIALLSGSVAVSSADPQLYDLALTKPAWNVADVLVQLMEKAADAG